MDTSASDTRPWGLDGHSITQAFAVFPKPLPPTLAQIQGHARRFAMNHPLVDAVTRSTRNVNLTMWNPVIVCHFIALFRRLAVAFRTLRVKHPLELPGDLRSLPDARRMFMRAEHVCWERRMQLEDMHSDLLQRIDFENRMAGGGWANEGPWDFPGGRFTEPNWEFDEG
ncbi:MAG: hypothetical protein M1832_005250 [Thelocarpon impressellum]|nr:MAG: hypothetical protein M1832_005250 [Thelocarpon impressellum]